MRLSKFLALGAAAASLIMIMFAPSHAQQGTTTQNQRLRTVKPAAVNQTGPTLRDHSKPANSAATAPGGVTVTPSARKRHKSTSPCIKSVLGGPCVGGIVGSVAHGTTKAFSKIPGASGVGIVDTTRNRDAGKRGDRSKTRDHRTPNQ